MNNSQNLTLGETIHLYLAHVQIYEENRHGSADYCTLSLPSGLSRKGVLVPEGSNVVETVWWSLSKIISFLYLLSSGSERIFEMFKILFISAPKISSYLFYCGREVDSAKLSNIFAVGIWRLTVAGLTGRHSLLKQYGVTHPVFTFSMPCRCTCEF